MKYKTATVGDIASVQTGPFGSQLHKKDYVIRGTPIVTVEHLGKRKMTRQNLPCVSAVDKQRLSKYSLEYGDIVFSRVGSVDRCSWVGKEENGWLFSGRCLRIRPREHNEVYHKFLYYFFNQESVKDLIRSIAVGATMPSINSRLLSEVPISYPNIKTQYQIADMLSAFDDKIELNEKINNHLEQIAQAIFKSWFVDFEPFGGKIPSNWRKAEFSSFLTPRIEKSNAPMIPLFSVTNTGIYPRSEKFNKKLSKVETQNKIAHETDLIFGMSREILNWGVMRSPIGSVSSAYNVFAVDSSINSKYLESFIKAHSFYFKDLIRPATREGQGVDKTALMLKSIYLPPDETLAEYYAIEDSLTDQIREKDAESTRLAALRDALIPKLMSGELAVTNLRDAK